MRVRLTDHRAVMVYVGLGDKADYILTFETEVLLNNTSEFSPYFKENTRLHHYKDQLINAV
jgi:hypothetical protein